MYIFIHQKLSLVYIKRLYLIIITINEKVYLIINRNLNNVTV